MSSPQKKEVRAFKCLLVGDASTGRSSFMKRHVGGGGESEREYNAALGIEVHHILFHTNRGDVRFDVHVAGGGQERSEALREACYGQSECAIIMFDVTSRATNRSTASWQRYIGRVCKSVPVVLAGNRMNAKASRMMAASRAAHGGRKNVQFFDVSPKGSGSFEKPFLWLARRLTADAALEFLPPPSPKKPPRASRVGKQKGAAGGPVVLHRMHRLRLSLPPHACRKRGSHLLPPNISCLFSFIALGAALAILSIIHCF